MDESEAAHWIESLQRGGWLHALARSLVGVGADDLVQDVAASALARGPDERPIGPWLVVVLRNRAARTWGMLARSRVRERLAASPEAVESASDAAGRSELRTLVARELLALDEPFRTTLLRRFLEERSHAEIAALDRVPIGTVRWRQHRGLQLLRERLDRRCDGDRDAWLSAIAPLARLPRLPLAAAAGIGLMKSKTAFVATMLVLLAGVAWFVARDAGEIVRSDGGRATPAVVDSGTAPSVPDPEKSTVRAIADPIAPAAEPARSVPADRARVRIRFVDRGSKPIAGVEVVATQDAMRAPLRTDPRSSSDADGVALVDAASLAGAGSPLAGTLGLTLTFHARGYVGGRQTLMATLGREIDAGTLVLDGAGRVAGRVVDRTGRALANARILAGQPFVASHRRAFAPALDVSEPLTGADGAFELDGLPPGFVWLLARSAARVDAPRIDVVIEEGAELRVPDFVIDDDVSPRVFGVARGPDGKPLEGIDVLVVAARADGRGERHTWTDRTLADGAFSMRLELGGIFLDGFGFSLLASDPERRVGPVFLSRVVADTRPLDLHLAAPDTVALRVTSSDGRPVETFGANLELLDGAAALANAPLTLRGMARFEGGRAPFARPPLPFRIGIFAPGHRTAELGPFDPASFGSELPIALEPAPPLRGVVRRDGRPVPGARVALSRRVGDAEPSYRFAVLVEAFASPWVAASFAVPVVADAAGRFEIGPPEAGEYRLHASSPGCGAALSPPFTYSPDDPATVLSDIVLELPGPGAIDGRLAGERGEPIASRIVGASNGDAFVRTTRTDSAGRFHVGDLEPGEWLVSLCASEVDLARGSFGFRLAYGESDFRPAAHARSVTVESGRTASVELDLRPPGVGRLRGRVEILGSGSAAHRVSIERIGECELPSEWRTCEALAGPDGAYELPVPAAGTWRFTVRPAGTSLAIAQDLELHAGDNERSLSLDTGAITVGPAGRFTSFRIEQDDPVRGIRATVNATARPNERTPRIPCLAGPARILRVVPDPSTAKPVPDPASEPIAIVVPSQGVLDVELPAEH